VEFLLRQEDVRQDIASINEALERVVSTGYGVAADRARIVELLLQSGANPNPTLYFGKGILHKAKDVEVLSLLLGAGAEPTAVDDEGWTPLMQHAYYARPANVELLLQHDRASHFINARGTSGEIEGWTALMIAVVTEDGTASNRAAIVDMLLAEGANTDTNLPSERSLLHLARDVEVLSVLIEWGLDVTALDDGGWTPLMQHAYFARPALVERLLEEGHVIQGIDAQATSGAWEGATALSLIAGSNHIGDGNGGNVRQVIKMLLLAGANPTIPCPREIISHGYIQQNYQAPLEILQRRHPNNQAAIALLIHALAEPERIHSLHKARYLIDKAHGLKKIAADTPGAEEKKRAACEARAPSCLKRRVAEDRLLPEVMLSNEENSRPWRREESIQTAVLQYVFGLGQVGGTAATGMCADVFVELMDMIAPRWDPSRQS
jgi:ankyrin repeat protein